MSKQGRWPPSMVYIYIFLDPCPLSKFIKENILFYLDKEPIEDMSRKLSDFFDFFFHQGRAHRVALYIRFNSHGIPALQKKGRHSIFW